MELFTLGIDLGKTTFHLVGMDQRAEVLLRKRFSRMQLLQFTANLKVKLIGMEACGGSHLSADQRRRRRFKCYCQVCWRRKRWHHGLTVVLETCFR
jgi:transposase